MLFSEKYLLSNFDLKDITIICNSILLAAGNHGFNLADVGADLLEQGAHDPLFLLQEGLE